MIITSYPPRLRRIIVTYLPSSRGILVSRAEISAWVLKEPQNARVFNREKFRSVPCESGLSKFSHGNLCFAPGLKLAM